jgi:hypothetical protein
MAEPRKDLGENDVKFTDVIGDLVEKTADSVSHALHPLAVCGKTLFAGRTARVSC